MKDKSKAQKTVVVLGMARSGTSVTAALLSILGVDIGERLTGASRFNPRGGFEDRDFMDLEKKIFYSAGVNYWYSPSKEKILAQSKKFDGEVRRLIHEKSKKKKIWGWKSPHTVLTIDVFLPYLNKPHFIVVSRNHFGTARSIVERRKKEYSEDFDIKKALGLVNFYDKIAIDFLEKHPNLPRIFVSFEDIVNDPIKEAERLGQFLRLQLTDEQRKTINNVIISRKKIRGEKWLIAVIEVPRIYLSRLASRGIRFTKKCANNPTKIPFYIFSAFKKNFKI